MDIATQIEDIASFAVTIDDQIGLIKRPVMPQRDRDKLQFGAMRNIGEAANPRGIELTCGQESGDFLIRAPGNEFNRMSGCALKV